MTSYPTKVCPELGGVGCDWFENAYLLPRAGLDFGVVATQTSMPIDLFSAYRDSIFLTDFNNGAPDSVEVPDLPSLPYELVPFSSLRDPASTELSVSGISVVALATTQARFDTTLDFVLDVGTLSLDVSGIRVGFVLPDFDGEVIEKLSWSTDVLRKVAGKAEQRIARRENPRQSFEVTFLLAGLERRQWANTLFGGQSALFSLPLWHDRLTTTAAILVAGTSATVASTAYCDIRVGGLCVVYQDSVTYDVLQVATVTSTTVTFASGTVNAYAVGAQLAPVRMCAVEPTVRSTRPPYAVEKYNVRFDVVDNDTGAPAGDVSTWGSFAARVLIEDPNVMYGELQSSMTRNVVAIDNGTGLVTRISQWDRSKHGFPFGFSPKTRAALWRVRQLLISLRGMQTSFWVPTHHDDLVPTQDLTIAMSSLVVENCSYAQYVNATAGRNKVKITFSDGTTTTRGITAAVETSATEETLTVDSAWIATKTPAEVSRIEFLELVRLDSDEVEIRHQSLGRATCQVPMMAVTET